LNVIFEELKCEFCDPILSFGDLVQKDHLRVGKQTSEAMYSVIRGSSTKKKRVCLD